MHLTARESEVKVLLLRSLTNNEIAKELKISAHTVKEHISSTLHKLGVRNRMELAMLEILRLKMEIGVAT